MTDGPDTHDPARVEELRRVSLERVGYNQVAARTLAARVDIPLQEALRLVKAGFPHEVAFEMLTSGERPVF